MYVCMYVCMYVSMCVCMHGMNAIYECINYSTKIGVGLCEISAESYV
jgi:hypothetical protein